MPDRESVITHLQIIHTWAEFARERDLQFFTPKHLEDIAQWSDDALALLKEHEHKDKMFHALEDDWKRLKELLKEQEPRLLTIEEDWELMDDWKIDKTNIPKDGSICDIILSDDKRGLGIVCAIIKNGRFMLNDMDITDKVLKWHQMPRVIVDSNGIFQWDNSN